MDMAVLSRIFSLQGGIFAVDFGKSLLDMIAAGRYDWVNPNITPEKFPVEGTGKKQFRTKLFHFGRDISSDDAVEAMRSEGFTPASHIHGLAYGAAFPEEQRKYFIACLGSSAQVHGTLSVVCLYRRVVERYLRLRDWDGVWPGHWRFLGVQDVSAA